MARIALGSFALLVIGCGSSAGTPPPSTAPITDASVDVVLPVDAGGGLYASANAFAVTEVGGMLVDDLGRIGQARRIPIFIRMPKETSGKLPVILWSHGGADGSSAPKNSGEDWCPVFTKAGFVTIALAHPGRTKEERKALCTELGISITDCETFKFLSYDRPHDVTKVLDAFDAIEARFPELAGRLDRDRIAMAGHSAGSGGTLMVAGASRVMGYMPRVYQDPRPKVFLAFSPQGPGEDGFTETSFSSIARPTLMGTGQGDDTADTTSESRMRVFDVMSAPSKYRLYIDDPNAIHATFDHEVTKAKPDHLAWLDAVALAFLDAHLLGKPEALAWLRSTALATASAGVARVDAK